MRWDNRKKEKGFRSGVLLLFFLLVPMISFAQEKIIVNLDQAIDRSLKISPEIKETQFDMEISKTKKAEADAALYPQLELLAYTGPSPRARGDQIKSPDSNTKPVISGIFGATDFKIVEPLYTFGKISALREAASKGINVSKAKIDQKKGDIILRTKQLYYGIILGKSIRNHLLDIQDEIQASIQKAEKQLELESPGAVESDVYKLKAFQGEIEAELNTVEKGISLAKDALRTSLDYGKDVDLDIADTSYSEPEKMELGKEEDYETLARNLRPEFLQLRDGLLAKKALVEAERGISILNSTWQLSVPLPVPATGTGLKTPLYMTISNILQPGWSSGLSGTLTLV